MSLNYLLEWWNLIFELPFVAALSYLGLLSTGVLVGEAADLDVDVDHDIDLDAGAGPGIEPGTELGHGHGAETGHDSGSLLRVLSLFGFGRVPMSIVFVTLFIIWGFAGWATNFLLRETLPPSAFILPAVGVAGLSSVLLTRFIAIGLSKIMPSTESYGARHDDFLGSQAQALFDITEDFGQIEARGPYGNLLTLRCITREGAQKVPKGSTVVIERYDEERGVFLARNTAKKNYAGRVICPSQSIFCRPLA